MLNIARQSADRWPQLRVDFMVYDTVGAFIKCATHDTTRPSHKSQVDTCPTPVAVALELPMYMN